MERKSIQFKADDIDTSKRTFKGYASTYDLDQGGDIILPGAFKKTLSERADRIKVMWEHFDPIGKPTLMREEEKGLYVEGAISNTTRGKDTLILMEDGVIDTMSIGYNAVKTSSDKDSNRVISEIKLFEFSLVTFPMNEGAIVTDMKSIKRELKRRSFKNDEQMDEIRGLVVELMKIVSEEQIEEEDLPEDSDDLEELTKSLINFGK